MQTFVAIILFLFPSWLSFPIAHLLMKERFTYGRKSQIGFSFVNCNKIHLGDNCQIKSFNLIRIKNLSLKSDSKIKYLNLIKGNFNLNIGEKATINRSCHIVSRLDNINETTLNIGNHTIIGVGHMLDMTDNISLGNNSILAGIRSELWTHSFYHPSSCLIHWQINGSINIGNNVYIGSSCILCAGISIEDNITLGAGSIVSKSLNERGLYVNQALRHIDFIPEESIERYKEIAPNIFKKTNEQQPKTEIE